MALTRAQLLMGNISDGTILSGQPQGVRPGGAGIKINTDGIIEVDSGTIVGVMKLAPTAAAAATRYNAYTWPAGPGTAGQQLETDGLGGLTWAEADNIPWTQKGQLVVGTGVDTDTLLNAGTNTSFLTVDSLTASGLAYTSSLTSAVLLPVGNNTTQRPATPAIGQIRYNSTDAEFEGYGGSPAAWGPLGGMPTGANGDKIFYLNSQNVTADYTLPTAPLAKNSVSAGPITIAAGITVTVPAGQSWSIV
jgi:hypothetical protein